MKQYNNSCDNNSRQRRGGFTLIELLIVITIIAILATVVFVALNPIQRFRDARNSRRWTDINNILTALHECIIDNDGLTTDCIPANEADGGDAIVFDGTEYEIVISASGANSGCDSPCSNADSDDCIALDAATDFSAYLKELPVDPSEVTTGHTEYQISIDTNNIITITSCAAETPETYGVTDTIKVSR